jgi:hypothetical protein
MNGELPYWRVEKPCIGISSNKSSIKHIERKKIHEINNNNMNGNTHTGKS